MTLQPLIDADVHSIPNFLLVVWYLQIWSKAKGSMCVWFHPIDLSTFSLTTWKEMIQPLKEAPRSLIRPNRFVLHRSVYLTPFNHMFDSLQWLHQCGCGKKISHSGRCEGTFMSISFSLCFKFLLHTVLPLVTCSSMVQYSLMPCSVLMP